MINIIVAADLNNAIGKGGNLPWHLKDDMRLFRQLTKGNTVIMGRKTYESIGHSLPDRTNIVVSSNYDFKPADAIVLNDMAAVMRYYMDHMDEDIYIMGGASMYRSFWLVADNIYLTRVLTRVIGADTFVPVVDTDIYECTGRTSHGKDEDNDYPMEFIHYKRKRYESFI